MFLGAIEPWHLIIILAIVVLIFGPSRIGNLGGAFGKSIHDFKVAKEEGEKGKSEKTAAQPRPEIEQTLITESAKE
jgi:sec-independent protein translocase protein TatA